MERATHTISKNIRRWCVEQHCASFRDLRRSAESLLDLQKTWLQYKKTMNAESLNHRGSRRNRNRREEPVIKVERWSLPSGCQQQSSSSSVRRSGPKQEVSRQASSSSECHSLRKEGTWPSDINPEIEFSDFDLDHTR